MNAVTSSEKFHPDTSNLGDQLADDVSPVEYSANQTEFSSAQTVEVIEPDSAADDEGEKVNHRHRSVPSPLITELTQVKLKPCHYHSNSFLMV
jgi:hypothetical protein